MRNPEERARTDSLDRAITYSSLQARGTKLDQLWQTRGRCRGIHVDENWYGYGDLPYDLAIDTALADWLVEGTRELGLRAKGVGYDGFPIDAGTIVAHAGLGPWEAPSAGDCREQPLPRLRDHPPAGRDGGAGGNPHGPAGRGRRGGRPLRVDLHPRDRHRRRSHRQPARRGMD